jgi:hypothetical protein
MDQLATYLQTVVDRPLDGRIKELSRLVAQKHKGVLAVLAYGSVLRGVSPDETLVDFYVLVNSAEGVSSNLVSRVFGKILPPNVYYFETIVDGAPMRCKYAVVAIDVFLAWLGRDTSNPYFWARFSQPFVIAHANGIGARDQVCTLMAQALQTAYANGLSLAPQHSALQVWQALFAETYRTELRPETGSRATDVVAANKEYYESVSRLMWNVTPLSRNWAKLRLQGKFLAAARLIKASFTFQGGVDYAVWKIERHTGEKIDLSPWQRKHPVIAALILLPRMLRKGVIR